MGNILGSDPVCGRFGVLGGAALITWAVLSKDPRAQYMEFLIAINVMGVI